VDDAQEGAVGLARRLVTMDAGRMPPWCSMEEEGRRQPAATIDDGYEGDDHLFWLLRARGPFPPLVKASRRCTASASPMEIGWRSLAGGSFARCSRSQTPVREGDEDTAGARPSVEVGGEPGSAALDLFCVTDGISMEKINSGRGGR